jgi:sortase A
MKIRAKVRYRRTLRVLEVFFWCAAAVLLGTYAYVYLDRTAFQAFQEWSFNRELQHRPAPAIGFVLHLLEGGGTGPNVPVSQDIHNTFPKPPAVPPQQSPVPGAGRSPLPVGALIGRIDIPRIGVRAMIVNGTTAACLRRAVGHIEGTPLFGDSGNIGLAGHRDTFFRGLRDIRKNDTIEVETLQGNYQYVVDATRIVNPDDTEVLDGAGHPTLTLVTCYPFDYIGAAPRRFIVQAHQVAGPLLTPQPPQGS